MMNMTAPSDNNVMTTVAGHYLTSSPSPDVFHNVTKVSTTSTTSSVTTTTSPTTVRIVVVHDGEPSATDMQIVDSNFTGVTLSSTAASADGDNAQSSSAVGIAVGVSVIGVVILIVIVALVYLLIKRRQMRRRDKSIVKIENPQYKLPDEERRLTLDTATLSTAPTVKFTANANAALINAGSMTHSRKRNEAPLPPIYRESPNNTPETSKTRDSKRAAPLPPQHVNLDLYEKDTPTVSNEDLTSILNTNTSVSPLDDAGASPMSDMSQLQPLIDVDRKKQVSLKNTSDSKNNSPKRPLSGTSSDTDRQLLTPEKDTRRSVTNDQDDVGFADDLTSTNPRAALLGKNATSNLSLDSYDKTKNPFFADA